MSIETNRLRERLGDATGIGVRTGRKYVTGRGVEVVDATGFHPSVRVFYRGGEVGIVKQDGSGRWCALGRRYERLDAAVLTLVAGDLQSSRQQ